MPSKNPANLFKNLTCAAIGLLVLFTTSIFVIKGSYQANINSLVDQATLLKEYFFYHPALNTLLGGSSPATSMPTTITYSPSMTSPKMYVSRHLEHGHSSPPSQSRLLLPILLDEFRTGQLRNHQIFKLVGTQIECWTRTNEQ
jgi:hypothetical protein